jgi:hypothetical protein
MTPLEQRIRDLAAVAERKPCDGPHDGSGAICVRCSLIELDDEAGEAPDTHERIVEMLSDDRVRQIVREEIENARDPEISRAVGKGCAWAAVIVALAFFVSAMTNYWRAMP